MATYLVARLERLEAQVPERACPHCGRGGPAETVWSLATVEELQAVRDILRRIVARQEGAATRGDR